METGGPMLPNASTNANWRASTLIGAVEYVDLFTVAKAGIDNSD